MNISTKAVLASALLTAVISGTSANAGRAELPSYTSGNIVTSDQKVFLADTIGGRAEQVITYTDNSVAFKKVSLQAPVADKEINR